jgi:hypothetical protein
MKMPLVFRSKFHLSATQSRLDLRKRARRKSGKRRRRKEVEEIRKEQERANAQCNE